MFLLFYFYVVSVLDDKNIFFERRRKFFKKKSLGKKNSVCFKKTKQNKIFMAVGPFELGACAFCVILSIMLIIFACTIIPEPRDPIIVLALVFYLFTPLPYGLCVMLPANKSNSDSFMFDDDQPKENALVRGGQFFSGMFAACGPCLILVLWHLGSITGAAAGLGFGSGVFLIGAVAVIAVAAKNNNDDEIPLA